MAFHRGSFKPVSVNWLCVDLEGRALRVRSADGRVSEMPMPADMFPDELNLQRVELDLVAGRLMLSMPGEPASVVELRPPEASVATLRASRPVVYLDQNHWSTLAAVRHGERPAREAEIEPARRLSKLVEAERILLPVSAGHLVETTPLHGSLRVALAGTVLVLSRGWQMRNPLHVRVEELARLFSGQEPMASDVFAPAADGFFGASPALSEQTRSSDTVPDVLRWTLQAVPQVLGLYDAVIDEEAIPDEGRGAEAAAAGWAAKFADLAHRMHEADEPAATVRRVAYANVQADMLDDIVRASRLAQIRPEAAIEQLNAGGDPMARMPFLGQLRQAIYLRMRNAGQRWEANDLVDIMFLCCAAGYADVVVGERRTIGYLRQARHPPPYARTATTLREALDLLNLG